MLAIKKPEKPCINSTSVKSYKRFNHVLVLIIKYFFYHFSLKHSNLLNSRKYYIVCTAIEVLLTCIYRLRMLY